jgi:hypothetical protein
MVRGRLVGLPRRLAHYMKPHRHQCLRARGKIAHFLVSTRHEYGRISSALLTCSNHPTGAEFQLVESQEVVYEQIS